MKDSGNFNIITLFFLGGIFFLAPEGANFLKYEACAAVPPAGPERRSEYAVVTGRGYPPHEGSQAKRRVMARRAAMVEAYKNAAAVLGVPDSSLTGGSGEVRVRSFIIGARLKEARYYSDDAVEVDIEVPLPHGCRPKGGVGDAAGGAGEGVVSVQKGGGTITESEWLEALKGSKLPGN